VAELTRLPANVCDQALSDLVEQGRAQRIQSGEQVQFESHSFDVPLGSSQGWEAAVLDHFQAMIRAITCKLQAGPPALGEQDTVGGSTWSLDVWRGHPLEQEAKSTLTRMRHDIESLRERIDQHNARHAPPQELDRVIAYVGQYVQVDEAASSDTH
jgi:hypothetical protein